jgi:multicomponent Na+:H+ antiporter subunit F
MSGFLLLAAAVVLATVALGLLRILRGPGDAERMMSAQLLGTEEWRSVAVGGYGSSAASMSR